MKGFLFNRRSSFLSVCILTLFTLASYQEASSVDRSTVVQTLNGRVIIKLEPHGSVRARVFQGKNLQYEFILDRETQQELLTRNIDRANVYLVGEYEEELVIDDLKTQKRYLLSIFDRKSRLRNIPPARSQTITIKGYSTSLIH
ncbi:hypothetical protein [Spirosoma pollinicola]|uniref:Uncharacterized protein n=1 Tax=Spirosoma pollinicola TaxID=2057025 RepID=A0A2K8YTP3_9BACT|nr:hypothetical protein [Spirosoma pollinicola]AUD00991.1 hypothetical protein CWM47_03640 [Spirosoma pollinicola]